MPLIPTDPGPSSITPVHGAGFSPAGLVTDGVARVLPDGTVRLHAGAPSSVGAATHSELVDISARFTVRLAFTISGGTTGGFILGLQNYHGTSTGYDANPPAEYHGATPATYVTLPFRVDAGVSTHGLRVGPNAGRAYNGSLHPAPAYTPAAGSAAGSQDFTLGRRCEAELAYTPPSDTELSDGSAVFTILDTVTGATRSGTYTGLPWFPAKLRLSSGQPDGRKVYLTASAASGSAGSAVVDLHWLRWTVPGVATPALHATGTLTVDAGQEGGYSFGLFDGTPAAPGASLRHLSYSPYLSAGTYSLRACNTDAYGLGLPAVCHFRAIKAPATHTKALIGQAVGVNPLDWYTGISGVSANGVSVSADGSRVIDDAGFALDTVGASAWHILEGTTGAVRLSEQVYSREQMNVVAEKSAEMPDGRVLVLHNDDGPTHWVSPRRLAVPDTAGFTGAVGTVNADGSTLVSRGFNQVTTVYRVVAPEAFAPYHEIPRVACGATTFAVCVKYKHRVQEANWTTGLQAGTDAISAPNPSAVCYLPDGTIAVAHSVTQLVGGVQTYNLPATLVSVYNATSHTLVRQMTELTGLQDVVGLACRNGRLAVVDNGPDRKNVKVYAIAGNAVGALQGTYCRPATWADDNGWETLWNLRDADIDDLGRVYVAATSLGAVPRAEGCLILAFAADGTRRWRSHGLGYTNTLLIGMADEPAVGVSSSNKSYSFASDGTATFLRAGLPPGAMTNRWLNPGSGQCKATMASASIGGATFVGWPANGAEATGENPNASNRLLIARHRGAGKFAAVGAVGRTSYLDGRPWGWASPSIDGGLPLDGDIVAQTVAAMPLNMSGLTLAPDGRLWFLAPNAFDVWATAPMTLNAAGNPVVDWTTVARVVTAGGARYTPVNTAFLAVSTDGVYVLSDDASGGPKTASTYDGVNSEGAGRWLVAYTLAGVFRWAVQTREFAQSIAAYPGGVSYAGMSTSRAHFLRADGHYLGTVDPVTGSDHQDFPAGTQTATRLPGGVVRVGLESLKMSGNQAVHFDDRAAATSYSGTLLAGGSVTLALEGGGSPPPPPPPPPTGGPPPPGAVTFSLTAAGFSLSASAA